ncbi:MAG: hypothetical protein V4487_01820 [Chlamydiota bacterium]
MSSIIQEYPINNKIISFDLTKPAVELSGASSVILENIGFTPPPEFRTTTARIVYGYPLRTRLEQIEETAQMLKETKEHGTRDRAIAFLKTALVVAVVAGAVLACAFGGGVGIALGIVLGIFAYMAVTANLYFEANEMIQLIEGEDAPRHSYWPARTGDQEIDPKLILALFGGGLIMPLYEHFTRESRLEGVLKQRQEAVQTQLSQWKEENSKTLAIAYDFYKNRSGDATHRLSQKTEECEKSLAQMEQLPERSPAGEEDLRSRLDICKKAEVELALVLKFYQQLFDGAGL